jgi:hypothetical protein
MSLLLPLNPLSARVTESVVMSLTFSIAPFGSV